ncbi:MAG: hypothetical protein JRG71_13890 [Deltaproteobacteria bacterium]|nr:hypothetical protein [Deltaproteobacteria bacterium]
MARPKNTTLRPDLGQTAYEYSLEAGQASFIGTRILPIFGTPLKSADYPVIVMAEMLRLQKTERAARSAYGRSDWAFDDDDYNCKENGWEEPVDDGEAEQYSNYFDAEEIATNRAMDVVLRGQEKRIADLVMDTNTFTTNAAGTKWDVSADATIKKNVDTGSEAMYDRCGLRPNVVAMTWKAFLAAINSAEIKDYFKYTHPHLVDGLEAQRAILAQYLGVGEVVVGDSQFNAANKGTSTASLQPIWEKSKVGLYRVTNNPQNLKDPCIGRTFVWDKDGGDIVTVDQYREEQIKSEVYRAAQYSDEKLMMSGAGQIITGVL